MANIKSIKDTGFLGSRKAIGTLRFMKAIDTPKVESKTDKTNKSKATDDVSRENSHNCLGLNFVLTE